MSRPVDIDGSDKPKVSDGWIRFLAYSGVKDERINEVMECANWYHVRADSNGHRYVGARYCMNRGVCPVCDEIESWTQALDRLVYYAKLFNAAKRRFHIWRVDFTVSKDLWPKIDREDLPRFARIGYETMQEYFDEKLGYKFRFGMDIAPQYWHSLGAGLGFYPHLHTVVPRLFYDAESNRVANIDLTYLAEATIKKIWRRRVENSYGKSLARFRSGSRERFSVKLKYYDHVGGSLPERMKYVYRGIVFNFEGTVNSGMDYSNWQRDFVRWSLLTRHKRHIGYGLFSAKNLSAKSAFNRLICLDYKTRMVRAKARSVKICPVCGEVVDEHVRDELGERLKLSGNAVRVQGLKRLKSDFFAELRREATGEYVSWSKPVYHARGNRWA